MLGLMRKNLKISFAGAGARYVLQTVSIIVLSRMLSPEQFGIVAAAMIGVTFSFVVLQIGGSAIVASAEESEVEAAFTVAVCSSVFISFIVSALYFIFESYILDFLSIDSKQLIRVLLLVVFLRGIVGAIEGLFSAKYEFERIAKAEVFSYFFGYFLVSIVVGYLTKSYWALVAGLLTQSILHFLLLFYKGGCALSSVSYDDFKKHLSVGCGMMVNKMVAYGVSQSDNLYINSFLGKHDLGVYSRAYQLMVIPTNFIGQVVGRVFIPSFRDEVKVYRKYQMMNIFLSMSAVMLIFIVGEKSVDLVLGGQWDGVYEVLVILGLAMYYRIDFKFIESVLIAKRETKKLAFANLGGLITLIGCLVLFSPSTLTVVAVYVFYSTFAQVVIGLFLAASHLGVNLINILIINSTYFIFSLVVLTGVT